MSRQRAPHAVELRLTESRERIRQALCHEDEASHESAGPQAGDSLSAWIKGLSEHPMLSSVVSAAQGWWESHPWRPAAHLANGLVRESLLPVAKKHPLALMLVAATIGGALVWLRPGRRLVKSLVVKGALAQSMFGLVKQPVIGLLANQLITWLHQAPASKSSSA